MTRILTLLVLLLGATTLSNAQTIQNFRFNDRQGFQRFLDAQEDFCPFPANNWMNTIMSDPAQSLQNKVSIIHFGSFDNVYSNHNHDVLERIQRAFPETAVLLVNNPKFNYPTDSASLQAMIELYDLELPLYRDEGFELWNCNEVKTWPTTFVVAPGGKIIDRITGALDYRSFELSMPKVLQMLKTSNRLNRQPHAGVKPSTQGKQPILQFPIAIEKNANMDLLFVSDFMANRIWVITPQGDVVHVIGSGKAGNEDGNWYTASFNGPWGMAWDDVAKSLYVADHRNHQIRKIDFTTKEVSTILGSGNTGERGRIKGVGRNVALGFPTQLLMVGNNLYVALAGNAEIWKCDVRTEVAERAAGSGLPSFKDDEALKAGLSQPMGMARDKTGVIFFLDAQASAVRAYILDDLVRTSIGQGIFEFGYVDGKKDEIRLQYPLGMCMYNENLYVADTYNHVIRKVDPFKLRAQTVSGSGEAGYQNGEDYQSSFHLPTDVVELGGVLYVTDAGNGLIRTVNPKSGNTSSLTLYNFSEIAQRFSPNITDMRNLDEVYVRNGNNVIHIDFDLGEKYVFDLSGFSNAGVVSRNDTLFVRENNMLEGRITLDYQLEPEASTKDIVIDFFLYFQEKERPEKQFFRGVTYIIPVKKDAKQALGTTSIQISYDPDSLSGGVIKPTGQKFME